MGIRRTSPVNSQVVVRLSISEVPSKIYKINVSKHGANTYLDDSLLSFDLEDLTFSDSSVSKSDINDLGILGELDVV